jgi:MoxR-like ATPase
VDVDGLTAALEERAYLADRPLALALSLSLALHRPLLLEGEAGVGKTEAAKALADVLGAELIRLQCYEGIDRSQALYAWDHPRQLVHLRVLESGGATVDDDALYDERFLLERPLLRAIRAGGRAVLLIDEIDRADEEFEAFLLEVLSDFQVSIPELGTIRAERPPVVVLTSNRSRELSDALKRRCLYHWIELPDREREMRILRARVPDVPDAVVALVAELVARLRGLGLYKPPGPAEAIDWARAAAAIAPAMVDGAGAREREVALAVLAESLGVVVKDHEDLELVSNELGPLLGG